MSIVHVAPACRHGRQRASKSSSPASSAAAPSGVQRDGAESRNSVKALLAAAGERRIWPSRVRGMTEGGCRTRGRQRERERRGFPRGDVNGSGADAREERGLCAGFMLFRRQGAVCAVSGQF
jgi:hypothetical protein